jgi:hypothetical protein
VADTQISAYISEATKDKVERYVKAHGVKKGHLIEQALLHHLQALTEIPADVIIPPRIVLTAESFARVVESIRNPPKPTPAMKALMAGKPIRTRRAHKKKTG